MFVCKQLHTKIYAPQTSVYKWKEENGRVFPDADEKITISDEEVLIDKKNLFAKYNAGILPKDAEYITLIATITRSPCRNGDFFVLILYK